MTYLYAFSAIFFWSTSAAAFKITLGSLNYIPLLFCTAVVSFLIFFISLFFIKKNGERRAFDLKSFFFSALLGFLNPFLYYFILFKAYSLLSAQKAMALNYTWPLALTLLSIPLLKQKPSRSVVLGMVVSFLGVLIIANIWNSPWTLKPQEFFGMILALVSSVVWGLYWILNMKDSRDDRVKLCQNFFWGAVYSGVALKLNKIPFLMDPKALIGTLYIGTFEMGVTFILWLKALKFSSNASQVARLIFITPFISLIWISFITGEGIQVSSILGLSLVVLGIIGPQVLKEKR
ncbi:MAG: hypothetical protein CME68_03875 [Halobacteriovoraceae bacterium]|nr:hypothetical protein [Halobacteriovoraceae bacterium]